MKRIVNLLLAVAVLWSCAELFAFPSLASPAFAQQDAGAASAPATDAWPLYPIDPTDPHKITRGPGGYFSLVKIILIWLVFLAWVKSVDWVSRDCRKQDLDHMFWVPIVCFPFLVGFLLFALSIPIFLLGFPLYLATYAGPFAYYVIQRNAKLPEDERVLTPDHIKAIFARKARVVGVKVQTEKKLPQDEGPDVKLKSVSESAAQASANEIRSRQSPGYISLKELLAEVFTRNAAQAMLDFTSEGVAVRYQIDSVWHTGPAWDRQRGDAALDALKHMAGMNPADRVGKQEGKFTAEYKGARRNGKVVSQGIKGGERVIVDLPGPPQMFATIEDLGMRDKLIAQLKELMAKPNGVVVFTGPPGSGVTTTFNTALKQADRYMRDFIAIEDQSKHEQEIENVPVRHYDAAKGQTPAALLPTIFREQPGVIVLRELKDEQTADLLYQQADDAMLVMTGLPAKEAVEGLLRVMLLKVPAKRVASATLVVTQQRLIRKLCPDCKEAYAPADDVLIKLGIGAGKVKAFYRPGKPKPPEPGKPPVPCPSCQGIGFKGQTGLFEVLVIDDALRAALLNQPTIDTVRKAAKAAGHRSLQDEGVLMVVKGATSLDELARVLKQ